MGIQNVLGVDYPYPDEGDKPWGTEHIAWATAVSEAINFLESQIGTVPADITQLQTDVTNLQTDMADKVETSSNVGTGAGLAKPKVGVDLPFKTIVAGANIVINESTDEVEIESVAAGTGDVVGPASAIDNNIAVFDSTTGKLIKDGGTTIAAILALISATSPNFVESASSGTFQTSSSNFVNVTNLSVTITTTTGPVKIELQSDSTSTTITGVTLGGSNTGEVYGNARLLRNGTAIYTHHFGVRTDPLTTTTDTALALPGSVFSFFDDVPPGTYTYQLQVNRATSSTAVNVNRQKLVAYEVK